MTNHQQILRRSLATGARGHTGDSLYMLTNVRYEREEKWEGKRGYEGFPAAGSHTNNDGEYGNVFISDAPASSQAKPFFCIISMTSLEHVIYIANLITRFCSSTFPLVNIKSSISLPFVYHR